MIMKLFNNIDEEIEIDLHQYLLIKTDDYVKYYIDKSEINNATDHKQINVKINNKNIDIDCEIADLISTLNNKGFKTKFCCSSHFYGEEWLYNKPMKYYDRNAIVIYKMLDHIPSIASGYIMFKKRYKEIEKLIPLCKEKISVSKLSKSLINTQIVNKCTGIYWYYPVSEDVAKKSVKDVTELLKPLL